jgi:putative phosphoribosyl transferase
MFIDRQDAGRRLAERLKSYKREKPLILALPRGGVPIAYEVAQALKSPLDVFVVRKVGVPWNREFGIGAVAPGAQILDEASVRKLGLTESDLEKIIDQEKQEMNRRLQLYRQGEEFPNISGKTVILVDDGLATGVTTRAAIQAIKKLKPLKLILAVPVGPAETVDRLRPLVDDLICLETPRDFYAVSEFYRYFPQVSDEEVIRILEETKPRQKR